MQDTSDAYVSGTWFCWRESFRKEAKVISSIFGDMEACGWVLNHPDCGPYFLEILRSSILKWDGGEF